MSWLFALNVALTATVGILMIFTATLVSPFLGAVTHCDLPLLQATCMKAMALFAPGQAALTSLSNWLGELLAVRWREAVTRRLHSSYLGGRRLYPIVQGAAIDTCDQRVATDVNLLTKQASALMLGSFTPGALCLPRVLASITFSLYLLLTDSGPLVISISFAWAVLLSVASHYAIKPLVGMTVEKEAAEGAFRLHHASLRVGAESIAFFQGEKAEGEGAARLFDAVYRANRRVVWQTNWLVSLLSYAGSSFPGLVGALATTAQIAQEGGTLGGQALSMGSVSVVLSLATNFMSGIQQLLGLYTAVAPLAGLVHRVAELLEALEPAPAPSSVEKAAADALSTGSATSPSGVENCEGAIELEGATIRTPTGRVLCRGLSVRISAGQPTIITGASGTGKSSVLRVLAGLWPVEEGRVCRPLTIGRGGIFFLPQRPYMRLGGSLREQIIYPHETPAAGDDELAALLRSVRLEHLLDGPSPARGKGAAAAARAQSGIRARLDEVLEWQEVLSGGEAQRLGFARMLYHRPVFAINDEGTSAMDLRLEEALMGLAGAAGVTLVSVAHRPSLERFHTQALRLSRDGSYRVETLAGGAEGGKGAEAAQAGGVLDAAAAAAAEGVEDEDPNAHLFLHERAAVAEPAPGAAAAAEPPAIPAAPTLTTGFSWRVVQQAWSLWTLACKDTGTPLGWIGLATVLLTLLQVAPGALNADVQSSVVQAVADNTPSELLSNLAIAGVTFVAYVLANAGTSYMQARLGLDWRKALTARLQALYFLPRVPYAVALEGKVDNVDQRIAADLATMTTSWIGTLLPSLYNAGTGAVICVILAVQYSPIYSGYVIAYVVFSVAFTQLLSSPLPRQQYQQDILEGDFRFAHARAINYAESIAFFHGERREQAAADAKLAACVSNWRRLLAWTVPSSFFITLQSVLCSLLGYAIGGFSMVSTCTLPNGTPLEPTNEVGAAVTTFCILTASAVGALSILSYYVPTLVLAVGNTSRTWQALQAFRSAAEAEAWAAVDGGAVEERPGTAIELHDGVVKTPGDAGCVLYERLQLAVPRGSGLLIVGGSGCGKSSLLRVLGGLWRMPSPTARLVRPPGFSAGGVFFLPQRPLLAPGLSLRAQLTYPLLPSQMDVSDSALLALLTEVGLDYLGAPDKLRAGAGSGDSDTVVGIGSASAGAAAGSGALPSAFPGADAGIAIADFDVRKLDLVLPYADILSGGEAQRLSFARLFLHRPAFAVCDESTSALDLELERRCLARAAALGITLISVAHRPSVARYHRTALRLRGAGQWDTVPVADPI